MFLHCLIYELKTCLRAKDLIIWLLLFPIVLGTLFKVAFGSLYEKNTLFRTIPAAVVEQSSESMLRTAADAVSGGENPLLSVTYTDEATALEMLEQKEIKGILYAGDTVTLTVGGSGIQESMLRAFAEQYNRYESVIRSTAEQNPQKLPEVMEALSGEVSASTRISLTEGNPDPFIQYFYNLIAMVAMFGAVTGLHIVSDYQANMSALGARRCCSPVRRAVSLSAAVTGSCLAQSVCMITCVSFLVFLLRIDFGSRLPLVYAAAILGGWTGVAIGFCIGAVTRFSSGIKTGITMVFSMTCCFLSGLMIGNIKAIIAEKAPWFNQINPVAVISDSFYCLNLYSDYRRFCVKILTMLIMTVVCTVIGIILSGRKQYASI
ncbi:MAG: ABC transporter permease [Oscillospiraceae bacterium]|nr:ABC transporter permease [Oscillospiraceae bacterium]